MITMTITLDDKGAVSVEGPLQRRDICYGMLEMARDIIKDHNDAKMKAQPAITPASDREILSLNGARKSR